MVMHGLVSLQRSFDLALRVFVEHAGEAAAPEMHACQLLLARQQVMLGCM